jgi:hypothetical protein
LRAVFTESTVAGFSTKTVRSTTLTLGVGTRGAGNHIQRGGASAAQILVRQIEKALIVGVGVDGGHGAAGDAKSVLQDFGDGSEAVGCAGGIGDHVMLRGIVCVGIHAQNESGVRSISGRRNNDFLDRTAEMFFGLWALGEQTSGFDDDIRANRGPVDFTGVLGLEDFEGPAFHRDAIIGMRNFVRKIAKDGVIFQQMRQCGGIGDVVDRDEVDVFVVQRGAHDVASDAAEAVDAYIDGHSSSEWVCGVSADGPARIVATLRNLKC